MPMQQAVDLLSQHIHALPHPDHGGPINMLPFAHDDEETRAFARMFCQAIINLLDDHGLLKTEVDMPQRPAMDEMVIVCRECRNTMVAVLITEGRATVDPHTFIAGVAGLNPECPHKALTADDMRLHMQREFDKVVAEDEAQI